MSKVKANEIANLETHLGYWLRFVSNHVSASFQRRLAKLQVTVAEWVALRVLLDHAPCSLTILANEMGMNKGAVSRLVDRLNKRGFLNRNNIESDKRTTEITLTKKGIKLLPKLADSANKNDDYYFSHLQKNEVKKIIEILKNIAKKHNMKSKPLD